jgi:hypothetical protein
MLVVEGVYEPSVFQHNAGTSHAAERRKGLVALIVRFQKYACVVEGVIDQKGDALLALPA